MRNVKYSMQKGFTLIELIVVIVILGILAATALPRFADFGADARTASLNAVRGSMNAASAMVHGKFLVASPAPTTVVVEGVTVNITNGYPTADANFLQAAGINTVDYTTVAPGSAATANSPATTATQIAVIPRSVAGSTKGLNCYAIYTQAATATAAPTITVDATTTSSC